MGKIYQWFAEPWGDDITNTNEIFSRQQSVILNGEDVLRVFDTDGAPHDVWRFSVEEIRKLWNERRNLNINFRVYNRETSHGPVRDVTYLFEKKPGRAR